MRRKLNVDEEQHFYHPPILILVIAFKKVYFCMHMQSVLYSQGAPKAPCSNGFF